MRLSQEPTVTVRPTFPEWLEQVYLERYTGAVLIHFGQGVPGAVQKLATAETIQLDNPGRRSQT